MRVLLLLTIPILLISCSPEKRLARLVNKHPELIQRDTVFTSDTTIVQGVVHDTIFKTQITKDTITIIDRQLTYKYYNNGKTTYLKGECKTDTIIKEVPLIVNSVNPVKEVHVIKWWDWLSYAISLLAIAFVILDRMAARKG